VTLDDEQPAAVALDSAPATPEIPHRMTSLRAAFEVLLCSEFPTQFAVGALLAQFGVFPLDAGGRLSERFVYLVSAIDTVVLLALIFLLMRLSGDRPRDVFWRRGRPLREVNVGLTLVPFVFVVVFILQALVYFVAPSLRNVPENPFQSMLGSPLQAATFVLLVLIAGGVREELQRAFLLHRFDQSLGGARIGVLITSIGFGLGHVVQGSDAMLITGALGALWGIVYVWRRNVISTMVSHSLFNAGEVLVAYYALRAATA
jgi:membrane protease YdiL (CAAX protease family)